MPNGSSLARNDEDGAVDGAKENLYELELERNLHTLKEMRGGGSG